MTQFNRSHIDPKKINQQFSDFLQRLKYGYEGETVKIEDQIKTYMDNLLLLPNQLVYIHHIKSGTFFHKGFDQCLGYSINQLTADFFIRNLHPSDLSMYFKISKALLSFVMDNSDDLVPFKSSFQINYRLKKEDGNYAQVLRQSTPFIKNKNGEIEAYISICSDISNISESNSVKWNISGPKKECFGSYLTDGNKEENLFSGRELDVLTLLSKGHSSSKISEELFISINTVNTHRKNLMRKANVNKTIDLISFGVDNGYL